MLCCSLITILLGQCGALAGLAKVRLFGGAGGFAPALGPVIATWSASRWLILGGALSAEIVAAVAILPSLYAIDVPRALHAWPICAAAARLLVAH